MRKATGFGLILFCTVLSANCFGQKAFSNCSAAFLNSKMVVDQYNGKGKCRLPSTATGKLTLQTVTSTATASKAVSKIPFRIAIKDKATQTLLLLTKDAVKQINVRNVLAKCKKGDRIVLLTLDNQYALPHNEILIN